MNNRSFTLSVLIAGAAMGLLGNLPILRWVNCLLCLWAWLGGGMAAVLYRRFEREAPALTAGQGAGLGAVAGLVGAVVGSVVSLITFSITAPILENLARAFEAQSDLSFGIPGPGGPIAAGVFFLVFHLLTYPLFGALGGLITANIGQSRAAAPGSV